VILDTRIRIETPEGVDLQLSPAGPVARAQAWAIDALLKLLLFTAAAIAFAPLGYAGAGLAGIAFFVISWLYPVLYEVLRDGATPGKRALRLRVVHDNGTPVGWSASMIRNLIRAADFLPVGYGFGLVCALMRSDFKRLGDLAAGTMVVHSEREPAEAGVAQARPIPPTLPLTLPEQRALVDFAGRASTLTEERSAELAGIARVLAADRADRVGRLIGMANWIVGRR
jgi:uncharacterized RDD family membrane protein YckC